MFIVTLVLIFITTPLLSAPEVVFLNECGASVMKTIEPTESLQVLVNASTSTAAECQLSLRVSVKVQSSAALYACAPEALIGIPERTGSNPGHGLSGDWASTRGNSSQVCGLSDKRSPLGGLP